MGSAAGACAVSAMFAFLTEARGDDAHWAYVPPQRHEPPTIEANLLVRDPLDAFVLARLEAAGIEPSPAADSRTLARRVALDLTGLPPSRDDVAVSSTDPTYYERYVDELLASPHYGERMATMWLDLARYADTVGYHGDQNLHAFPYRDWVVDAFNANLPFDRFTLAQIAGDLLPNASVADRIASGFNRLNMVTREGGAQPGEYLAKYAADRVRTVATTWLGSTLGCAECHDHKYDPFTIREFYSFAAFFADVKQWGVYTTYAYTPNPDLPGFTNDHPFPPEIEVDVPYLVERAKRIRAQADELALDFGVDLATEAARQSAFEAWRSEVFDHLARAPDSFVTIVPRLLESVAAEVHDDGRVVLPASASKALRLEMRPSPPHVAALELELLPDAAHGDSILRNGATETTVQLTLAVQSTTSGSSETKPKPIRLRAGESDRALPRYSNGHALRGIVGGWRVAAGKVGESARAVYLLESPLALGAGDSLLVTIDGAIGAIRVRLSPLAFECASARVGDLTARLTESSPAADPVVCAAYLRSTAVEPAAFKSLVALDRQLRECDFGRAPTVITEAWEPRPTRVLPRGNWQDESGPLAEPGVPNFLQPITRSGNGPATRLDLARWLVAPENPLTARVFVNRIWKMFFGRGLVTTLDDFGLQGDRPSHPDLLDTLAVDFIASRYDVKALIRRIVTSSTYRRSAVGRDDLRERDPYNRLLAAQSPRRLEAEFVRDNALAISGLLVPDLGGPPVFPYQPPRLYEHLQFPDRDWRTNQDDRQWRRGIYTHWQRTFLHPALVAFDAPSREECTATRVVANTPQQALTLLNDPQFVDAARGFASRSLTEASDDGARIVWAFETALARPPTAAEHDTLLAHLVARRGALPPDGSELSLWTDLCRIILNLHECTTRY